MGNDYYETIDKMRSKPWIANTLTGGLAAIYTTRSAKSSASTKRTKPATQTAGTRRPTATRLGSRSSGGTKLRRAGSRSIILIGERLPLLRFGKVALDADAPLVHHGQRGLRPS